MIFSRRRGGSGRHARDERSGGPADVARDSPAEADAAPEHGPYDSSEAPEGVQRLDLGSLHIPAVEGVEVRVQANPDGSVQQVVLVDGGNALQLAVFAAPRTEGIWDEFREEIRTSLFNDGVAAQESEGDHGVELRARVRTPEGLTDLRFIGVDGPRWMVRGIYQGPVAVDPDAGARLVQAFEGLVVDRGDEAKPVREPLPLRLPREVAEQQAARQQVAQQQAEQQAAAPATNGGAPAGQQPHKRKPSPRPRRSE
ncbi:DUF3710 domain-containing protein [Polymorphospora rubra]|uniref:DUF3710 domain-containing protein n=1 Tax=Polymorphospora rubra TaxID=338584 RepID=A0A810N0S6_9ACTN|nr:DUF3710 domain-containing protein [Polymorphospora rubra]BCJ67181.1 hypothetical protein Prubr_42020 [Polymorphospora rubra]